METSEISHQLTFADQISSWAASLASLTVLPGSVEARRMTVTSGRNIAALLKNSDPVGCSLRMCLVSERPFSTKCYLTWKVWRTPLGRLLFRLAPLMPRIDESEYSLLPTPRAIYGEHPGMKDPSHLTGAIHLWPTMTAGHGATGKLRERDAIIKSGGHKSRLEDAVAMWPTPQSRDWKGSPSEKHKNYSLPREVGGQLNPTWVCWLMGFPLDWLDVDGYQNHQLEGLPREYLTESPNSRHSETP